MTTAVNMTNQELLDSYQKQFEEHKALRISYHRQKPEIKNILLFGAGGAVLGATIANTLLGVASLKKPGSTKGVWGVANLLAIGATTLLGSWLGIGVGAVQKKTNPEQYYHIQKMFDKETEILEQLNDKIENLGGKRLSYES